MLTVAVLALGSVAGMSAQDSRASLPRVAPTVDQILTIKRAGSPEISPDGRWVAYTVRQTNWDDNAYDTQIWLADAAAGVSRQLTNGKKSSQSPAWSPDGSKLAFTSDRTDKTQIYLISPQGGEADPLTSLEDGMRSFAWSPDGTSIAYTATEAKSASVKDRDKKYGEFQVVEQDQRMTHLFTVDVATRATKPLTSGAFTVGNFTWSPDGRSIAFDHRINPELKNGGTADISIVTIADASVRTLVTQDGPDTNPVWSPDGSRIAFQTSMANPAYMYRNNLIATVPASGGAPTVLSAAFDEDSSIVDWKTSGIYFAASARTYSYLYKLDPQTKAVARISPADHTVNSSFSLSNDGQMIASMRADAKSIAEVYVGSQKITDMNAQTASWATGTLDVVSWKSQDRATKASCTSRRISTRRRSIRCSS